MIVRIVVVMTVLFFALQLWRPKFKNPPAMADFEAPSDVKQILRGSCYACHSNETQLAWFDKIVPAYQLVARDVLSGRMVLNFSDLGALPKTHQSAVLYEAVSQIEMGAMPLPRYTYLHPRARVTPSQLAVLRNYVRLISPTKQAPQADVQARTVNIGSGSPRVPKHSRSPPQPTESRFSPIIKTGRRSVVRTGPILTL